MNQTEIDELRRLHAEATPGKWTPNYTQSGIMAGDEYVACEGYDLNGSGGILEQQDLDLIVAARNALPRLLAALEEARAERDKANGLVKRMEHDNRVIARELDCSWGGSANPEHECKEDNPCLLRQYQDAEERLEATATFLERATTRQCYLAKQAAEAERDAAETQAWDALGRPDGTHDMSNVQRLCEAHIALKAKLASKGACDIAAERSRQMEKWGNDHDDEHSGGALAYRAAELAAAHTHLRVFASPPDLWGLLEKHRETRQRLVIAGALVAAEIDRLDRAALAGREGAAMTDHPKPADLMDTTQGPPHPAVGAKRHPGLTMKKLENTKHPIQPIGKDEHGVVRFKRNAIVCHLLDHGGIDLNAIACMDFSRDDREQFAQLIGYSHSGAHDLSYVSSEVLAAAEAGGTDADRAEYLRAQLDGLREALREPMAELFGKHPDDLKGSP